MPTASLPLRERLLEFAQTLARRRRPGTTPRTPTAPTSEVAIADTRLGSLNTVTLFPFNPDLLVRTKGGLEIYSRMTTDEQVKAALGFKKAALLAPGWDLVPRGDSPQEQALATTLKADLLSLVGTFEDDLWELLSAFEYGFSVSELVWEDVGDRLRLKDVKARAPHAIDFVVDPHGNIVEIVQLQARGRVPLPREKFVHFVHNPAFGNPYGHSDLRAAYRWWFYKQTFQQSFAIYMEQLALPPKFATYPRGEDSRAGRLRDILASLQANTAVTLPEGWRVELLESTRQPEQTFLAAIDRADLGIARALLVPEKLGLAGPAVRGGSYALAQTQGASFFMVLGQVAKRLEKAVQAEIVDRMVAYTAPTVPAPQFRLLPLSEEAKAAIVELWIRAVTAGAVQGDLEDENHLRELLGFPARDAPDEGAAPPPGATRRAAAPLARPVDRGQAAGTTAPQGRGTPEPRGARGAGDVIPLLTPAPALRGTRLAEGPPAEAPAHEPAAPWRPLDPLEERADLSELAATFERGAAALATAAAGPLARLRATLKSAAGRVARRRAPAAVAALTVPAARRRALAAALATALRALWDRAQAHARRALPPGAPTAHAEARGLVGRTAEQYLRARAQTLADGLVDDAMSRTRAVLLGVLTQPEVPPLREILFLLDQALDTVLPPEEATDAPPRPTPARLETLWRTAAADAIGHARFAVFTDPELRGFVRAFRYTAVLDARTRAHHRAWDGVTLAVDDPTWYGPPDRRPPNGWNCRCTLIPVTAVDAVALTPHGALPSVSPVDPGFK